MPDFGEPIFSEIMYDPDPLEDDVVEWIEVKNVSMATIDLGNCVVEDRAAQSDTSVPAAESREGIFEPGAFILLAWNRRPHVRPADSFSRTSFLSLSVEWWR